MVIERFPEIARENFPDTTVYVEADLYFRSLLFNGRIMAEGEGAIDTVGHGELDGVTYGVVKGLLEK